MKPEIRILGIDDAPFDKFMGGKTKLIGAFFRGGRLLDGILSTEITVDGNDATDKIISMVKNSKFYTQIRAILLNGIAVGGFNVIDIKKLSKKTKIPVIIVIRNYPDLGRIKEVLTNLGKKSKIKYLENAGKIYKSGKIYTQFAGTSKKKAEEILKISTVHANVPEPLRVAHLIASGVTYGESRGKA